MFLILSGEHTNDYSEIASKDKLTELQLLDFYTKLIYFNFFNRRAYQRLQRNSFQGQTDWTPIESEATSWPDGPNSKGAKLSEN